MGRPAGRPLKVVATKRCYKDKDGLLVRNSTPETYEIVKGVCDEYAKNQGNIKQALVTKGIGKSYFYEMIRRYANCKKIANLHGIGLRQDAEVKPAKVTVKTVKKKEAETSAEDKARFEALRESDELKNFHADKRDATVAKIKSVMGVGVSLEDAVRFSGVPASLFDQWMRADPELYTSLMESVGRFSVFAHKEAARATTKAADKGRLADIIMLLERRFPAQWGKIDSIDITTRDERDQRHTMTIKANDVAAIEAEMEIEEI